MIDTRSLERRMNALRFDLGLLGGRVRVIPVRNAAAHLDARISLKNFLRL